MVLLARSVEGREGKYVGAVLVLLFIILCSVSSNAAAALLRSGSYHTDYRYYIEFTREAFIPGATFSPESIVKGGTSIIMTGVDGAYGLHYGVHFEPAKYIAALLFAITGSLFSVHVFYLAAFFSPLAYGALRAWRDDATWGLIAAVLIYSLVPAAIPSAIDSLRPFILLFPGALLFYISLIERRPLYEQIFFLNLLALSREEGLIFMMLGLIYMLLRSLADDRSYRLKFLFLNGTAWLLVYAAYLLWTYPAFSIRSYDSVREVGMMVLAHPLLALGGVFLVGAASWYGVRRFRAQLICQGAAVTLMAGLMVPIVAAPFFGVIDSFGSPDAHSGRYGMLIALTAATGIVLMTAGRLKDRRAV